VSASDDSVGAVIHGPYIQKKGMLFLIECLASLAPHTISPLGANISSFDPRFRSFEQIL
jgi:hypothetical protein